MIKLIQTINVKKKLNWIPPLMFLIFSFYIKKLTRKNTNVCFISVLLKSSILSVPKKCFWLDNEQYVFYTAIHPLFTTEL